ncbi:hypothetical protein BQ8794_220053 [Mesorhizobium prunaredense]|uniref:Uncharacterized protein n=1 Tax=Mesorhizobium prunaredense TaxID=1631249 RepID=A0A1R3V8B2_9HYPH|nr:hypothetical protein BQ8794_220053 [Mesorhizobium prunaredense]
MNAPASNLMSAEGKGPVTEKWQATLPAISDFRLRLLVANHRAEGAMVLVISGYAAAFLLYRGAILVFQPRPRGLEVGFRF